MVHSPDSEYHPSDPLGAGGGLDPFFHKCNLKEVAVAARGRHGNVAVKESEGAPRQVGLPMFIADSEVDGDEHQDSRCTAAKDFQVGQARWEAVLVIQRR